MKSMRKRVVRQHVELLESERKKKIGKFSVKKIKKQKSLNTIQFFATIIIITK